MAEQVVETPMASLPQNLEAERALLGSMILDNRQIPVALDHLPQQALRRHGAARGRRRDVEGSGEPLFFSAAHQMIFEALLDLYEADRSVDLTTLGEQLLKGGQLESVGGATYLATLDENIFSLDQVSEYARIVMDKWRRRTLIRAARTIVEDAMHTDEPSQALIDRCEKRIFEIAQEHQEEDFVHIGDQIVHQLQELEERAKGGGELPGLPTNFPRLDMLTGGLRKANMIIVAARPSMGKTSFAMNVAAHAGLKLKRPVAIFSLEMSKAELTTRLMCTRARVSMSRVMGNAKLRGDELDALHESGEALDLAPIYVDDTSSLSLMQMRSRARRLKAHLPDLSLIILDYLQLMHAGTGVRYDNRQQEVTEISRSMKSLARELEVPVVAISQLSRQSEQRRGKQERMPRLSDLRESGAIEQDADVVMFIHQDRTGLVGDQPADREQPTPATLLLGKQRNGPAPRTVDMIFMGQYTQFVELAPGP